MGACRIMPAVPANTASVNIHKNSLSKTIATYFQSSFTCAEHVKDNRMKIIVVFNVYIHALGESVLRLID